jgi:2-isopropylmalate synthase
MGMRAVSYAKEISAEHNGASVEFSAEAASTTSADFLERVIKGAIDAGADIVNVPDTVGQRTPAFMRQFYRKVIEWVQATNPDVIVSAHNHNDMGNAVANTFSLVEAATEIAIEQQASVGIQLETTICGLGERAGNADVFPVMANIFQTAPYAASRIGWQFKPVRSVEVANFVMEQAGTSVGRQSSIVGSDILVHRSGIHSDGIDKGGHRIYTPIDPTFWGHGVNAVHEDGKYQGTRGRMNIV